MLLAEALGLDWFATVTVHAFPFPCVSLRNRTSDRG
jgi:hypothetical protein